MKTSVPVFFLMVQLGIAVVLLAISKWSGLFQISLDLDRETSKALIPMVAVNVLGLKYVNQPPRVNSCSDADFVFFFASVSTT